MAALGLVQVLALIADAALEDLSLGGLAQWVFRGCSLGLSCFLGSFGGLSLELSYFILGEGVAGTRFRVTGLEVAID